LETESPTEAFAEAVIQDQSEKIRQSYGLNLASGKQFWEQEAASPATSSAAVAQGKVVANGRRPGHLFRITPTVDSFSPSKRR
jgi:hypothetical protein